CGTELGVAALDELLEAGRGQAGRDSVAGRRRELRRMTRERAALHVVLRRDVDDERGTRRIVDEVVADAVRPPRLSGIRVPPPQAAVEDGLGHDLACRGVVRMSVGPVRCRAGSRTAGPDQLDDLSNVIEIA